MRFGKCGPCVLLVVSLASSGCVESLPPPRPEKDLLKFPLSPLVDISTIAHLATLAARDRVCSSEVVRAPSSGLEERLEPMPARNPPRGRSYRACMEDEKVTFCNATAADLSTLKTLMDRDPRLRSVTNFAAVVAHIDESCGAVNVVERQKQFTSWPLLALRRCEDDQPVLLTHAIAIREPQWQDNTDERASRWQIECYQTYATSYITAHCQDLEFQKVRLGDEERRRASGQATSIDELRQAIFPTRPVQQQGFEVYFCPQAL